MTDEDAIVAEVRAFYGRYIDAWSRRDAAEVARCYDRPYVGLSGEHELSLVTSDADHDHWYQQVLTSYDQRGWKRSGIAGLEIWPLSSSLAQLVADVFRYRQDGSVLDHSRSTYMLRRRSDGWKVVAYAVVDPPFSGPSTLDRPMPRVH